MLYGMSQENLDYILLLTEKKKKIFIRSCVAEFIQHLSKKAVSYVIKKQALYLLSEVKTPEENILTNFEIQSFDPKKSTEFLKDLELYREQIVKTYPVDKRIENFKLKRLNFLDQEAITIFKKKSKIVGFSTAWHRKSHYPLQTARILNRFWLDKTLRRGVKIILRLPIFLSIEHQSRILRDKGFQWIFISLHFESAYWPKLAEKILNRHSTIKRWKASKELFLVCPNTNNPTCWQWLLFAPLFDKKVSFPLLKNNKLSKEDFIEKFKKRNELPNFLRLPYVFDLDKIRSIIDKSPESFDDLIDLNGYKKVAEACPCLEEIFGLKFQSVEDAYAYLRKTE